MRTDRRTAGMWHRYERLCVALAYAASDAGDTRASDDAWKAAAAERDRLEDERAEMADAIDAAREETAWACGARA
jgi:hypothetical protein